MCLIVTNIQNTPRGKGNFHLTFLAAQKLFLQKMYLTEHKRIYQQISATLNKMNISEKLCLQWNDFKDNLSSSFGELRQDKDLTDVTLACEDGRQVEAHKVILAASSPFFMHILKRYKHPHPLIYMRGLKLEDLQAIVDFLYFGEANIFQEKLDSFLALAEELQLKGFTGADNSEKVKEALAESNSKKAPVKREKLKQSNTSVSNVYPKDPNTAIVLEKNSINAELHHIDEQIKSMMTVADLRTNDGRRLATCNTCGKQSASNNMRQHIETNHITGVSHTCNICGKISRSRDALRQHRQKACLS